MIVTVKPIYVAGDLKLCGSEVKVGEGHVPGCLHVVSIGTREKMFEVWAETVTGALIFR